MTGTIGLNPRHPDADHLAEAEVDTHLVLLNDADGEQQTNDDQGHNRDRYDDTDVHVVHLVLGVNPSPPDLRA
jgi:hypothetical protein